LYNNYYDIYLELEDEVDCVFHLVNITAQSIISTVIKFLFICIHREKYNRINIR